MRSKRPYGLPSLKALSAFDSAARHLNFRAAADDLNVTPAAISHQIKALEAELGISLFHRHRRGVNLTPKGETLADALQLGFGHIAQATSAIRQTRQHRPLTIQCTTAMSALWLTPQLVKFWSEHPDVLVNQHVTDQRDLEGSADLVIDYGTEALDGARTRVLFRDTIRALASPNLADGVRDAQDILSLPLIHLAADTTRWTTWAEWFRFFGVKPPQDTGVVVNSYAIALQLAQNGRGAVLGWSNLTQALVEENKLTPLGAFEIPAPRPFRVHVMPTAPEGADVLFEWLVAQNQV